MLFTTTILATFQNLYFLGLFLFFSGVLALLLHQKNLILILMALELALLGISVLFVLNSLLTGTVLGQLVIFVLLTLGGAESALGLALLMLFFNLKSNVSLNVITDLKF